VIRRLFDSYGTLTPELWGLVRFAMIAWVLVTVGLEAWLWSGNPIRAYTFGILAWTAVNLVLTNNGDLHVKRAKVAWHPDVLYTGSVDPLPRWWFAVTAGSLFLTQLLVFVPLLPVQSIGLLGCTTMIPVLTLVRARGWSIKLANRVLQSRVQSLQEVRGRS